MNNKLKAAISVTTFLVVAACNTNSKEEKTAQPAMPTKKVDTTTAKFEHLNFASKKDTICGMPLRLGIEDTLILNGKIYGFCGTGCKEEFEKQLKEQHKR